MTVGKKVILRAIPYWREVGTEKWVRDEEARYVCPVCGNRVFRGVVRCNRCKEELDLDQGFNDRSPEVLFPKQRVKELTKKQVRLPEPNP